MKTGRSKGFTLVEVSASVALVVIALGLAVGGYVFTLKNVNEGDVQTDLDIDVMLSMEHLKKDLRLSSLDHIHYYPEGPGPYQALSFPMAEDTDGDGMLERDADRNILWSKTVVYHIRPTTPNQLVKTTFEPRDNNLSDAQRQQQLESVVKNGVGDKTYNGENASSLVIFENLLNWKISPKAGQFDAYAQDLTRERVNLGYMFLDSGTHDVTFKVVGKNDQSSGYNVGIDQLLVSASGSAREAEAQLPAYAQSGAMAELQYIPVGSWKGKHQLYFPASSVGSSFTLKMENDRWEETNFGGTGYLADNTEVAFLQTIKPYDYVVKLKGMANTWEAQEQTGDTEGSAPTLPMKNMTVRIMQKGADLLDNGNWLNYSGKKCRLTFSASELENFKILNAYIGESISPSNAAMDYLSGKTLIKFVNDDGTTRSSITIPKGESRTSQWVDLEIDRNKNYLVSFRIANNGSNDSPKMWHDVRAMDESSPMTCRVAEIIDPSVTEETAAEIARENEWSKYEGHPGIKIYDSEYVYGLESIEASYPESGTYVSQVFDTRQDAPVYDSISWNADLPSGTALAFKVRTGSKPDLSDAPDWENLAAFYSPRTVPGSWKRYVQFQAILKSSSDGMATPILKDVTIDWEGGKQLVDIGGIFTKGPNFGTFEVSIDGQPLRSALIIDLEIYKDIPGDGKQSRRVTSSLKLDITPRNSDI